VAEIHECQKRANMPPDQLHRLLRLMNKHPEEFRKTARKSGWKREELEEFDRLIKNAQRKVRRVEAESNLPVAELKRTLQAVKNGETLVLGGDLYIQQDRRRDGGSSGEQNSGPGMAV
jgi:hypothetical protein